MNCEDVNQVLSGEPVDVQQHLKSCMGCRELVRVLSAPVASDQPSPRTLGQIEQRLLAGLRVVRPMAPAPYLFTVFAAIFISAVSLAVYRLGARAIAVMSLLQATAILGALAICTGALIYSLALQMAPGSKHRISPRLLPIAILISLTVSIAVLFQFQQTRDFWARAWACLRTGTPIGFVVAIPFWLVLRRGAILSPAMTGAATGLLSGLAGTSVLEMHCPNLDAWHILVSHLGVAVLCSVAGLAVGLGVHGSIEPLDNRTVD